MTDAQNIITRFGAAVLRAAAGVWGVIELLLEATVAGARQVVRLRVRGHETLEQMYAVGVQSLPVVIFSLTFMAMMLITEFSFHMKMVLRQDSLVPAFSTVMMVRELGPVLTCLLLTSRVGAGIAAEIGTMKITEQIDALRLLAIDPVEYLTLPRWVACLFACVCLSVIAVAVAILGGAFISSLAMRHSLAGYFQTMFLFTRFKDFIHCIEKAAVFGTIVPIVACHHGFRCRSGSQGVGDAATNSVVHSSLLIIAADFVLTYIQYAL